MASHNKVAHAWAHQTGRLKRGHNMFYDGNIIFSYGRHFPIARITQDANGREVVLFTTEGRSVSTAKHKTITRRACRHMVVFTVPFILDACHGVNMRDYLSRIEELYGKAKRARKCAEFYLKAATDLVQEAKEYVAAFNLTGYENYDWSHETIVAAIREAAALQAARAEAARIEQERKHREWYRTHAWPRVKSWLRGDGAELLVPRHINTPRPLPRINGDKVETTWDASVPLPAAIRMYQKAIQCRRSHKEFQPFVPIKVGDFQLTRIKANGDLVVGCHDIPFWFMHYAAKREGIDPVPSQAGPDTTHPATVGGGLGH